MKALTLLGAQAKPDYCRNNCRYAYVGSSFVPDHYPESPRLALFLEAAGPTEALARRPLAGRSGSAVFITLLAPFGLTRSDVFIGNSIRCYPGVAKYPTGSLRHQAEGACRHWDNFHGDDQGHIVSRGIAHYAPNLFVITYHPAAALRVPSLLDPVKRSIEKAVFFADRQYRPCVLMGEKAAHLVFPQITKGGLNKWQGHWFEGAWPTPQDNI